MGDRTVSGKQFINTLFEFSSLISNADGVGDIFPTLVDLARKLLIFDNIVIYHEDNEELRPTFAKSVGRGRSKEADIDWGDTFIDRVFKDNSLSIHQDVIEGPDDDRLKVPYYIGTPLRHGDKPVGVLIMIRFGGPEYNEQDQKTFIFIADHISRMMERGVLVNTIDQIEGSQRMWEMQENFVATVSHDLRTPLGFIKGYTTTLLREDADWDVPTYREFLGIIDDEADRLHELIDNLLDSSRLQSGTLQMNQQVVRLDVVLRDMIQRSELRDIDVNLELEIVTPGILVEADPMRLGQVFDNLINNSIKYAPGSTVVIRLEQEDDQALIKFIDDGPGIDPEHLERIFQRFYRVPETRMAVRGSGLGLYICRKIINAHQGEIRANSEIGKGTTFIITIPITAGEEKD
jgi:signal transduction histidine kinase